MIDLTRRSAGCLLALLLAAGCGGVQQPPANAGGAAADGSAADESPITVYFSQVWEKPDRNRANPDNIAQACANALAKAQVTLDVCCHEIDNKVVVEAILAAHLRGVRVRVITETDYLEELGPKAFAEAEIPMRSDRRSALMHQKFAVIDGQAVWTGSFNFTENCAYKNNNSGLLIRDAQVAENYARWFQWFWTEATDGTRNDAGRTPHPKVRLENGTDVETRLTTFDKADRMVELPVNIIRDAKKSIKFMAFSFTHKKIAAAMKERAKAGVPVFGVFEQRNLAASRYNDLVDEPNVTVVPDGNGFQMHHKVIIVDDAVVLAGSFNFSESAAKDNDENYVVISGNAAVAKQFVEEFNRVFKAANQKLALKESAARR